MKRQKEGQMDNQISKSSVKDILFGVLLFLIAVIVLIITYKTQLSDVWEESVHATLMLEHKNNYEVILSKDYPVFSETFICKVPDLKMLKVQCKGTDVSDETRLIISLTDSETGKEYFRNVIDGNNIPVSKKKKSSIKLNKSARKKIGDTIDKPLVLTIQLENPYDSKVSITADNKQGLVDNVNGDALCKTNVIYDLKYSNCSELRLLYFIFCATLLFFVMTAYILLIVKKIPMWKAYVPLALILGLIFNFVIMMHGVPDEPWHIDTAYKYSNKMLFVEDTGTWDTIYKRKCDVWMSDMLSNGVESNSYYQLLHHFFERPNDTELQEVSYIDTTNMANGIAYIPTAIGISIGRILGMSYIFSVSLGRFVNLMIFVLLVAIAIRISPKGKSILAAVGMLPIALQQGASASYDAVTCGAVILLGALCYSMRENEKIKKRQIVFLVIMLAFLATVKGGVYLPMCLLLIPLFLEKRKGQNTKDSRKKIISIIAALIVIILGIVLFAVKFYPAIKAILEPLPSADMVPFYSLHYMVNNIGQTVGVLWRTFIERGDVYISGALGGILAWHDIRISWTYVLPLFIGLLLLANVEGDQYQCDKRWKITMLFVCIISFLMITFSQIFAFTTIDATFIQGIQGRYFLPLLPLIFYMLRNSMVYVTKRQANYIWMGMLAIESMIILQFVTLL